jgi:hypothetical protein
MDFEDICQIADTVIDLSVHSKRAVANESRSPLTCKRLFHERCRYID